MADINVKSKLKDVLGLINSTLNGKIYSQADGTIEINLENGIHGTFASFFIKRQKIDGKQKINISFKQGILKNKLNTCLVTFKDLPKIYIAITPSESVTFLVINDDRFTVFNLYRDANLEVIHGIDKRESDYDNDYNNKLEDDDNVKSKFFKDANSKKRKERRKIFITI